MRLDLSRRDVVIGPISLSLSAFLAGAFGLGPDALADSLRLGPARAFDFDRLAAEAKGLAQRPYRPAARRASEALDRIDYESHWQIKFRRESALWSDGAGPFPVEFFHLGRYSKEPVTIHVVEGGKARQILYDLGYFTVPESHVAHELPKDIGFAGFRVMSPQQKADWIAFLGASYFRSAGPTGQYGLSARGIAIDTAAERMEEFPRFTTFWLEADRQRPDVVLVYALLDGPSIAGAYRFAIQRNGGTVMDVHARLFPRTDIGRMGVAPLTSMYWFAEYNRSQGVDWRPEVHDSDGLAMWSGSGERIWRPLNNLSFIQTNSFVDSSPKGFGLLQRDRDFRSYEDDGVFYERRPSLWVEPLGEWGEGAIQLVELPTDDEIHDNIVAYWVPQRPVKAGSDWTFDYRLHWLADEPYPAGGRVTATRIGAGGTPGQKRPKDRHKFVIDFSGGEIESLTKDAPVEAMATASRGRVRDEFAIQVVGTQRWRAFFDLDVTGREAVDLRCYLRLGDRTLTETWLYQYFPTVANGRA